MFRGIVKCEAVLKEREPVLARLPHLGTVETARISATPNRC
jgi:hypothetical protein